MPGGKQPNIRPKTILAAVDNPYKHIGTDVVGSDEHLAMSLESAKAGMVLLKKGPLPLAVGKSVAVLGQQVSNPL